MINIGRFKKSIAVVLAMLMVVTMLPIGALKTEAAGSDKTTLDLSLGSIMIGSGTVSQSGQSLTYNASGYMITQSASGATTNTIKVTGGTQNIALNGVRIDVSSISDKCAFSIESGASVNLTLNGTNTLKSSVCNAGLKVPSDASVNITGQDTDLLTVTGGDYSAGIGGGYSGSCGNVTITGGTVTAVGNANGAGIGGGRFGTGGSINISGGTVTATGGELSAGIGGGEGGYGSGGHNGSCVISGGTVTATGGAFSAGIGGGYWGNGGTIILTGGKVMAAGGQYSAGIGAGAYCSSGKILISGGTVTAAGGSSDIGNGYNCYESSDITITGGSVKAASVTGNVTDNRGNAEHCVTVNGLTANTSANCSINGGKTFSCKTDLNGKLYLWMPVGDNKATVCCDGTYYGANAAVSNSNIIVTAGTMAILDISQGDITISDNSVTGKDSSGHNAVFNTYGYVIMESFGCGMRSILVSAGTHNIVLKNVNVDDSNSGPGSVFSIEGSASVNLTLSGTNILKSYQYCAGIEVAKSASLSVTGIGSDSLEAYGGYHAAGIGGNSGANGDGVGGDGSGGSCGRVTISGGTIKAIGKEQGAGIGGGSNGGFVGNYTGGSGGEITITGGIVTATGGSLAAGIGGGFNGSSKVVNITGGNVTANSGNSAAGIGGGAYDGSGSNGGLIAISGGTVKTTVAIYSGRGGAGIGDGYHYSGTKSIVKISGGSVNTPSISGIPTSHDTVYPTVVTLPSGTDISSFSVIQGNAVHYGINDMQADDGNKLYLYLPAYEGDTKVNVTADGKVFSGYYGTVKNSGTQANPNTLKMDQSALSFVNSDTQTFTYGDMIALNKAVTGDTLSGVSYTYSGTDKLGNTYTGSPSCPTNAGDDYAITAMLPGNVCYYDAVATKHFKINQKDIGTNGIAIGIASETYSGGEFSPNITVAHGSNTLTSGTDYKVCDETGSTENPTYTNAGSYNIMVKGIGNYTGSVVKTFAIAQKPITLTLAASQSSAKAGGTVTLTAAVQNLVNQPAGTVKFKYNGTTIASGNITESGGKYAAQAAWTNVPAGEYNITAEYVPAENDNYSCAAKSEIDNYSITKYDQTGFGFQDEAISKTYGENDFTVSALGGQDSGSITYESSDTNIATVTDAGIVTIKSAGTVTITAKKASDSIYNEAVDTIVINIGKAAASIKTVPTASDIAVVGKLSSVALKGGAGSVEGTFHWTSPDTIVSQSGNYEITFTAANANYLPFTCKIPVKVTPVITSSGTGVQYDLTNVNLPNGVTSVSVHSSAVSQADSGSSSYSIVNKLITGSTSSASPSAVKLYNLSLTDQSNQAVTGFTGKITVKIPIPNGMSGDLHVYWYNDTDGKVTDMNAKQENGYLVFETTHFSYYAVTELTAKPKSGSEGSSSNGTSSSASSSASSSISSSDTVPNPDTGSGSFPFIPAVLFGINVCGLVVVTKGRRFRKKS